MSGPWPFRHIGLKLVSLGLALLLWMVVSGEETVERGLRVPLELQQMPGGLDPIGEIPTTVDVRVRGASGALSRISAGDAVAVLDLRTASEGRRLFPMTPQQVRVPFGVEIVQVTPSAIAMTFERSVSRQVPILAAVEGRPAPGYVVGQKTVNPPTVEVVGPVSAVKNVAEVLTEPVSVSNARENVTQTVLLGLIDSSIRLKNIRSAAVTVQIVPAPLERSARSRAVHLRGLAPNLQAEATPASVDIALRASREALAHVEPDDVVAYVDVSGLGAGVYTLTVHADMPQDVGVTHIDPPSVQVRITSGR